MQWELDEMSWNLSMSMILSSRYFLRILLCLVSKERPKMLFHSHRKQWWRPHRWSLSMASKSRSTVNAALRNCKIWILKGVSWSYEYAISGAINDSSASVESEAVLFENKKMSTEFSLKATSLVPKFFRIQESPSLNSSGYQKGPQKLFRHCQQLKCKLILIVNGIATLGV